MNITLSLDKAQAAKVTRRGPIVIAELMRFLTPEEAKEIAPVLVDWHGPIDCIQRKVAEYYRVPLQNMTASIRSREFAWPRQRAMWLAHELTHKPLTDIGRRFGGRDHATVIHAIRSVNERMAKDPLERAQMKELIASLEHLRRPA